MTNYAPLALHVPEPAVRPGGLPDFTNVPISTAGAVARPDVDADPESIRDLAYSIIRVLDRDGEAVGPWAGFLSDEELLEGLRHMMTLRAFDARPIAVSRTGTSGPDIEAAFPRERIGEAMALADAVVICTSADTRSGCSSA